jgi:hypothetical protein
MTGSLLEWALMLMLCYSTFAHMYLTLYMDMPFFKSHIDIFVPIRSLAVQYRKD